MTDQVAFGMLTISFDDRVLRPREWTAAQSEWAAEIARTAPDGTMLELCAGAGHIGLLAARVEVRQGRLETAVREDEQFPVIIADPPWVPRDLTWQFPEDPLPAIDGGVDGLDVARACLAVVADHLAPGGSAVLQLGTRAQADTLRHEPCLASGTLVVADVRQHVRGVLVRVDRPD